MNDGFEPLESGEVISVQHDTQVLGGHNTFKVGELNNAIKGYLEKEIPDWNEEKSAWFSRQGIDCEAFRFSSAGWQKGRIRLSLEFCPEDELNSTAHRMIAASNSPTNTNHTQEPVREADTTPIQVESSTVPVAAGDRTTELQSVITSPSSVPTATTNTTTELPIPAVGTISTGAIAAASILATNGVAQAFPWATGDLIETSSATDIVSEPRDAHGDSDVIKSTTAPASDVVLEPRDLHPNRDTRDREVFDEISFDFDRTNSKDRRTIESNSGMELDLTDLGLDISEHDFLNFETSWLPNPAQELTNPSSHEDRPENSGMLIDEVWHEIESQPNWPGIN
jgi:KGK domain